MIELTPTMASEVIQKAWSQVRDVSVQDVRMDSENMANCWAEWIIQQPNHGPWEALSANVRMKWNERVQAWQIA